MNPKPTTLKREEDLGNAADHNSAWLAAIVESSDDAIFSTDLNSLVTSWNKGAERIFGYSVAEIIGTSVLRLFPADRQAEEDRILDQIRRGEPVDQLDTIRQTKSGHQFAASVTISPIKDAEGTTFGVSEVVRDITRQKQHEIELSRLTRLYAALSHVNQAIVWTPNREKLLPEVCKALVEHGGFHLAWIGWHNPETRQLVPVAIWGDESDHICSITVYGDDRPEGGGPTGMAFRTARPYICNDLLANSCSLPWRLEQVQLGLRASAAFPIRLKGKVHGTLSVYSDEAGFFQDKEIALLEEAAGDISFALDNFADKENRREAEKVAENERLFSETMIESMPGIVYFYDEDGRFIRWNQNFEVVSGYSPEEIAQMHPLDFFADAEKEPLKKRITEVFAAGNSSVEATFISKDGTATPHLFTGRRVFFDGEPCLVGMGVDISQRKHAELALQLSLARFHAAAKATDNVIWDWELKTNTIWWNDKFQTNFGYQVWEIVEGIESWTDRIHPEDKDRVLEGIHTVIDSSGDSWVDEYRLRRGDGSYADVFDRGHVIRDEAGHGLRMVGALQDITERKNAEKAMLAYNSSLEEKVAERTEELQSALVLAEAADRTKSAFLATMSHELRTPLNSILGFTGILIQEMAGPLNTEQSKQLGMVRNSARHLLDLINDVLDLSKIEAGQLEVRREPFQLPESLDRVASLVKPMAERKGLELILNVSPDLNEMVSDQRRIEQILINVITNAIKFTEHGHVSITADLVADLDSSNPSAPPCPAASLRVEDTGIGITPENLTSLFQPFRQIDSGLTRKHEGTGLGLAICKRLTTLLNGKISATSEWGKGSTFTVAIPIHPPVDT